MAITQVEYIYIYIYIYTYMCVCQAINSQQTVHIVSDLDNIDLSRTILYIVLMFTVALLMTAESDI